MHLGGFRRHFSRSSSAFLHEHAVDGGQQRGHNLGSLLVLLFLHDELDVGFFSIRHYIQCAAPLLPTCTQHHSALCSSLPSMVPRVIVTTAAALLAMIAAWSASKRCLVGSSNLVHQQSDGSLMRNSKILRPFKAQHNWRAAADSLGVLIAGAGAVAVTTRLARGFALRLLWLWFHLCHRDLTGGRQLCGSHRGVSSRLMVGGRNVSKHL